MFCYQSNFTQQCEIMTSERFTQLVISDDVVGRIKAYRTNLPVLRQFEQTIRESEKMKEEGVLLTPELEKELKDLRNRCKILRSFKTGLPTLMYQATFALSHSAKGYEGYWRKQSHCVLNGLFMLDIDHIKGNPQALFDKWVEDYISLNKDVESLDKPTQRRAWANSLGIMLVHITPSGEGLRIVAKADINGNIADNQDQLSKKLGVEPDEACKDASRCSFCPTLEDILYLNKEIFEYNNEEYNKKYVDLYRGGNSARSNSIKSASVSTNNGENNSLASVKSALSEGYHGVSYETIIEKWFTIVNDGRPTTGDRHRVLFKLACDLRYIVESAEVLEGVLKECSIGKVLCSEGSAAELHRIASDAFAQVLYKNIPKRMQGVLSACGIQSEPKSISYEENPQRDTVNYKEWYQRLRSVLEGEKGYNTAIKYLPEEHQLAGVLAAGAMFGTYLSRVWWEHFDGKDYRLSFLVYIIGGAASGKSFIVDLDRLIMAPMIAADRVGREWERQYKEEMKKRSVSGKNQKTDAPEQQHPVIRYVPSTISNAMLYRRLTDAIDNNVFGPDGQPLHLHCYTLEPELATALRAQTGSWAGKNDIELKSFHNEYAGVDYANEQSVNGVIQVNWNQVVSGTSEAMSRKIKPSTVLDGLVTRLVLFNMPNNDFSMIEKRKAIRDNDRECYLRSIGLKLDQLSGQISVDRLVDYCYKYEENLAKEARIEQDYCLDYFRKRIPVIMMRYTIVKIVLREIDNLLKGEPATVTDNDLEFAKLIGDWCLNAQIHMFGEMVMQAQARERDAFVPRRRHSKIREMYAQLPEELTTSTLVENGCAKDVNTASVTLRRWFEDGLLVKTDTHTYKKKYKEIPV